MMTLKQTGIILVLIFSTPAPLFAAPGAVSCQYIFLSRKTTPLAAIRALSALRLKLDLAQSKGTNSIELTALTSNFKDKEDALVDYFEKNKIMSRAELIEEMKREISVLQGKKQAEAKQEEQSKEEEARRRQEQEQRFKESVIDGNHAIMQRIEPGSFKMGEVGKKVDVTLTKPFDMMATQTTQVIWKKIADLANAKFGAKYQIDAEPSTFNGNIRPVETVSYEDVQIWIQALNELSQTGEPALASLIPNHKKGDIYRLPTEAEWEFVARGRGQFNDAYHFGNDEAQLSDYSWHIGNSNNQTHPVAQKKPLVIEGKEFYDMHGNVWEWVHDWNGDYLPGAVDPQGPTTGSARVLRGGSWDNGTKQLPSAYRAPVSPRGRSNIFGFRLVRTVK